MYKGVLMTTDNYMNVQLVSAEEWQGGRFKGSIGEVLIRCNNILYMRMADEDI